MKKVLIGVDEALWGRMKARAAERGRSLPEVVEWAFRQYLQSGTEGAEVGPSVPEKNATSVAPASVPGGRPSIAEMKAMVYGVTGAVVKTGTDLSSDEDAEAGPPRGSTPRDIAARREWFVNHPEAVSQDPSDKW